jgi:hypothetical protein
VKALSEGFNGGTVAAPFPKLNVLYSPFPARTRKRTIVSDIGCEHSLTSFSAWVLMSEIWSLAPQCGASLCTS